ncbi:MAG: TIGR02391 family protein [Candidatus Bathyarchaeia archaeon]
MMISSEFHKEIHSKLMQRKNPTILWVNPFDNAWVGFVLSNHKHRDEINMRMILEYFNSLFQSVTDISVFLKEEMRNIGALSLCVRLFPEFRNKMKMETLIKEKIIELDKKGRGRFSLFNSPEIFYATVAGLSVDSLEEEIKHIFLKHILREFENNWFNRPYRFALYSAAFLELKINNDNKLMVNRMTDFLSTINVERLNIDEIIPLLWFLIKYHDTLFREIKDITKKELIKIKKEEIWKQFESLQPYFSYNLQTPAEDVDMEREISRSLSTFELAMMDDFLACLEKTYEVDPNEVFDLLSLHPIIREACEKLFKDGHYSQAIFEAYKALINYVKEKSEEKTLDGKDLMGKVFRVEHKNLRIEKKPILQLNELTTREDIDEQEGFMYIFMGVVEGIRNPKAHAKIEQKDPFKTLEYLSLASLLAKRVDEAKVNRK